MFADILQELSGRGASAVIGLLIGGVIGLVFAYWRRRRERLNVLAGDARDTVVIHYHVVEAIHGPQGRVPRVLRIRDLGQGERERVIPNGHLASVLLRRASDATPRDPLISMEGAEGSYLLETLSGFVCDRVANAPFEHRLFVMAPCCEPAEMAQHQPIAVLLISVDDLALFESWPACREIQVEHGSDGARVLTLREMARRFRAEREMIESLRQQGKRTQHVETMYVLDLAIDPRCAPVPTKPIPWGRFEHVLKQMNLE